MKTSKFILITVFILLLSRVFTGLGAPGILNFIAYPLTIIVFLQCFRMNHKNRKIVAALTVLISIILFSGLINDLGVINIILNVLLVTSQFLLFLALVSTNWRQVSIRDFHNGLVFLFCLNVLFSYIQFFILGLTGDDTRGLFIGMGAGAHINGAVALLSVIYIWFTPLKNNWLPIAPYTFLNIGIILMADAKQVVAALLVALSIMVLLNSRDFRSFLRITAVYLFSISGIYLLTASNLGAFSVYLNTEILEAGFVQKFSIFGIIYERQNFLQLIIGLGPGQSVGRLATIAPDYMQYLGPLGFIGSEFTSNILLYQQNHWLSNPTTGSSFFQLTFSWAGIYGDLGMLGVGAYLYILKEIYKEYCCFLYQKILIILVVVFGFVFSWLEEPAFMGLLFVISGLLWQQLKFKFNKEQSFDNANNHQPVNQYKNNARIDFA